MTDLPPTTPQHKLIDLADLTIGKLHVIRRMAGAFNGHVGWLCRCVCGEELRVDGGTLREAHRVGKAVACKRCRPDRRGGGRPRGPRQCSECGDGTHTVRACPVRAKKQIAKGARCPQCEGMSWRRPRGRKLCACAEPFALEPPRTLAEQMAMPQSDQRTFPCGVSL